MTGRARSHVLAAAAVLVVLLLAVVALVLSLMGTFAPPAKSVTAEGFSRMAASGAIAGLPVTLDAAPAAPQVDLDERRTAYLGVDSCGAYWVLAKDHQSSEATATVVDPEASLADTVIVQQWDSAASASSAFASWPTCRQDYQKESGVSRPVKVLARGTSQGVDWQYAESLDLDNPVHQLTLRRSNVIADFSLPDGPAEDWRDLVIERFASQVDEALGS